MTNPSVVFEHVVKEYRTGAERVNVRAALPGRFGRRPISGGFRALDDISFELSAGQSIGIIGHNGAGKSTLLKLVSRVIAPTTGRVCTTGTLASLIELGVGFHPDLSGSDNVRFAAAILGMGPREVRAHYDEIVAFAGLERFMDMPVKRYSSGMLARLGFSVASHLEADVVAIDEVLSVGDADFQRRGYERLNALRTSGATVLFVTHNLFIVPQVCEQVLWLERGRVRDQGPADEVVGRYRASTYDAGGMDQERSSDSVELVDVDLPTLAIAPGDSLPVTVTVRVTTPLPEGKLHLSVAKNDGLVCAALDIDELQHLLTRPGTWTFRGTVGPLHLRPGFYRVWVSAYEEQAGVAIIHNQVEIGITVLGEVLPMSYGFATVESEWEVVDPIGVRGSPAPPEGD